VKESVTLARNIGDVVGLAMLLPNHSGFLPQSQLEEKEQYLWEGLAYAHEVNHPIQIAWIGPKLSGLFLFKGDLDEAEKWIVESLELARHIQSDVAVSGCLLVLATLTTSKGDFQASYQYLLEAQPLIRKVGSFSQDLTACAVMGWTLCGLRDYPAVAASLHEALAMAQKSQQLREYVLGGMAVWLGFGKEQYERAAELFSLYIHHPDTPPWALQRDALLTSLHTRLQNELDLTAFSAAWERGKQLDLDTVIAALLEEYRLQST
jgi:hypothetical protein